MFCVLYNTHEQWFSGKAGTSKIYEPNQWFGHLKQCNCNGTRCTFKCHKEANKFYSGVSKATAVQVNDNSRIMAVLSCAWHLREGPSIVHVLRSTEKFLTLIVP